MRLDVDRTWVAVLLAAFIVFAAIAGLGVFLGFGTGGSLAAGAVLALLAGALIWAAARRADTFHEGGIPPVEPGFPGPPKHEDDAPDQDAPGDATDRPGGDDRHDDHHR